MDLTASRKHFQTSRATTSIDSWANTFRSMFEHLTETSWADKVRDGSHALRGAAVASFHSWRPLGTEYAHKIGNRLSDIYDQGASFAREAYDQWDPVVTKIDTRCVQVLDIAAHGARELRYRAAASRQLMLIAVVFGLPAAFFLFFALAHWVADDAPADPAAATSKPAAGLPASGGTPILDEPQMRMTTILVEPPAPGGRVAAGQPPAIAVPLQRSPSQPPSGTAPAPAAKPAAVAKPAPTAAIVTMVSAEHIEFDSWDARPAVADPVQVASPSPERIEPPSAPAQSAPAHSEASLQEPTGDHYPFTTPRPRPSRAIEVASLSPSAGAASTPDRSDVAGGPSGTVYQIQLAAIRSRDKAQTLWESLNRTDADLLGALQLDISSRTTRNNQPVYRLRAGPLPSKAEAEALCSALERRKVDCLVIKPSG